MSARRSKRRKTDENYPTPRWSTLRFAERWPDFQTVGNRWIEVAAGSGAIIEAIDDRRSDIKWTAVERRDTTRDLLDVGLTKNQIHICDFVSEFKPINKRYDVAITNPPFSLTMAMILKMMQIAEHVVIFQSMNFMGSSDRNEYLMKNTPDVYMLPDRVSHSADGQTDSVYSAWYHWPPNSEHEVGMSSFNLLRSTSLHERKRDHQNVLYALDEDRRAINSLFDVSLF